MSSLVNLLVVGGGAGGGAGCGGGGGAGQVVPVTLALTELLSVVLGAAGAGAPGGGSNSGANGGNTSIGSYTALGGGGGGAGGGNSNNGLSGACGGGGGGGGVTSGGAGTNGNAGGGGSDSAPDYSSGGGGGNASAGADGTSTNGGNGGNGVSNSITGSAVNYGAGGGGACGGGGGTAGAGGTGGGGAGSVNGAGGDATGYGSGGGGGAWDGSYYAGGNGSPGVVIISFPASVSFSYTGSYTAGSDGAGNTVWTLTSSGTLTLPSVTPATCQQKCALTIAGSQVAETGTYAMFFSGSGDSTTFGTRLPDDLFAKCQSDGGDILFTSDSAGTQQLPMELVSIDTTNKKAVIWVAIPLTAGTDTTVYVRYQSNAGTLTQPAATDTYGSKAAWNGANGVGGSGNTLKLVSHDLVTDSTGNYTLSGGASGYRPWDPTTYLGLDSECDGNGRTIGLSGSPLDLTSAFTVQLWNYYISTGVGTQPILQLHGTDGFMFASYKNAAPYSAFGFGGVNGIVCNDYASAFNNTGAWKHQAIVYNGGTKTATGSYLYKLNDTSLALTAGTGVVGGLENTNSLGESSGGYQVAQMALNEYRLSAVARSSNYLSTDYKIQSSTTLVTVGVPTGVNVVTPASCTRRCPLVISGSQVAETATYAVLFDGSGDSSAFGTRLPDELFTLSQADGGDICFTDVSGTQLPVELVSIDAANKKAEIWVAAALSSSTDTVIYVYYKSNSGTLIQPTASASYGSKAVWNGSGSVGGSGNYMAIVSHDGGMTDSTGNYTPVGSSVYPVTSAKIGSGSQINGSGAIQLDVSGDIITPSTGVTVQLWAYFNSIPDYAGLFQLTSSLGSFVWNVGKNGNSNLAGYDYYLGFRGSAAIVSSNSAYDFDNNQNSWHLFDIAYNGGGGGTSTAANFTANLDGSAVTLSTSASIGNSAHPNVNYLGSQGGGDVLPGNSDEFRVTNTARSANYRLTDYYIQSSTSLVTVGTPGANTAPGVHIISVTDTVSVTDTAGKQLGTHYIRAFDLVSVTHTTTCHNSKYHLANTDRIAVTDSATLYVATHHVVAADLISVQNRAASHDDITRLAVTDQFTVTDTATVHLSVKNLTAADILSVTEAAKGNVPGTTYAHASDVIQVRDTSVEIGPIYLSVTDIVAGTPYVSPITGVTIQLVGLQDTGTVSKLGTLPNTDRLSFGDIASCGKIRADAIALSASDTISLTDKANKSTVVEATDTIVLGDMALPEVGYPADDVLNVGDVARANVVRNLQAQDVLIVDDSFTYFLPYELAKRIYNPFIGTGTRGNPAPPPATLFPGLKAGEFSLYYPPLPAAPADIVVLRKPEFGNKDRLQFNRISRETRGGTLIVFADPMWPKTQTIILTFAALKPPQAFNLQRFMETYLGLEIGLMDWEGRQWTGVIINPNDPIVQDSKYSFTGSFEFEGQLVSDLVGQTV